MIKEDNIAAISTASMPSGVAIIRVSGDSPLDIAAKMFHSKTNAYDFEPYKLYVGTIDCGNFKDFGMCVYFKAPKSYTGEDMIEFHCHGGQAITRGVLETCLKHGARLAERGEFTKRAFLNGKLSLSSCEGLIDMINSQSVAEAKAGYYLYRENLLKRIRECQDDLTYVLALIDANIDYPEEDIEQAELDDVKNRLVTVEEKISKLSQTFNMGSKAKNGVQVVICGKPNVGKSSLLNAILCCDKAIVTSIEGTTRDVVEGFVEINGIRFNFYDTAGIRESDNTVEKIGIERSKKAIETADVVIFMVDATSEFSQIDEDVYELCKDKNIIKVVNKTDQQYNGEFDGYDVKISAKNGDGIEELKQLIYNKAGLESFNFDGDYLVERRHYEALKNASESLIKAINAICVMPLDIITIDIRQALLYLGLISGETADENVINEIFAKFCVGK